MPLVRSLQWDGVDVWVWKIAETVDELSLLVPEPQAEYAREMFSSLERRAEWLSVRAILARQFNGQAHIIYDRAGKPLLEGVDGYVSVSHTKGYAVVAFSRECEIGVDVELAERNVLPVAGRFMPAESLESLSPEKRNVTALVSWCAKEALYKITGDLGGNFKDNISVGDVDAGKDGRVALALVGIECSGEPLYVADYSFNEELLVVLCRRRCDVKQW